MKRIARIFFAAVFAGGLGLSVAQADVSALTLRFGGGCNKDNGTGSCVLKVAASGTDLGAEGVQVYTSDKKGGAFRRSSARIHTLSGSGFTTIRVRNVAGACFEVRTAPNGNDKPDRRSRAVCE